MFLIFVLYKQIIWSNCIRVVDHNFVYYYYKDSNHQNIQFYLSLKYFITLSIWLLSKWECNLCFKCRKVQAWGYHVLPPVYIVCFPYLLTKEWKVLCYKLISFFRNVDTKYRFVNWFNCNPYPNMFAICLNHGLTYDKCRNSFPSVKLARIKSLNPVPYRHAASLLISKNC